ncbi:MAG: trypsin-like peptidase domain-containing protein [Candidatus Limnocylindrales bacterium]
MPLDSSFAETVVFIVGSRDRDGMTVREPIGTGFIVSVPSSTVPDGRYQYVVTAAHVVENEPGSAVRFNRADGGVFDGPVPRWYFHATEDVAAAPMGLPSGFRLRYVPESGFLDKWDQQPKLGDKVYFVGLLASITAMAEANVPMVRSGTLGRLRQERVPVRRPDGSIRLITAHLIDCRAYAGFSGSPCFIESTAVRHVDTPGIPGGMIGDVYSEETLLLGLVSAHLDQWEKATTEGDIMGTVRSPVNTGVGVVVPVEAIRQLLEDDPDLARYRQQHDARAAARMGGPGST